MKRAVPFLLLPLGFLPAFAADIPGGGITPDHLSRHVRVLASDAFEGRGVATPGEQRTVDYVVSQFQALGLEPGTGGFRQHFACAREMRNFLARRA